jgi:hypothetical protein
MNTNDPKGEAGSRKTPLGLIPAPAMEQTALVHKLGAEKYGAYNWRKTGVCASTYVHAILRHLNAWRDGEDNDRESGLSHIAHIGASCNILLDAAACGRLEDDREKRDLYAESEFEASYVMKPEWHETLKSLADDDPDYEDPTAAETLLKYKDSLLINIAGVGFVHYDHLKTLGVELRPVRRNPHGSFTEIDR